MVQVRNGEHLDLRQSQGGWRGYTGDFLKGRAEEVVIGWMRGK